MATGCGTGSRSCSPSCSSSRTWSGATSTPTGPSSPSPSGCCWCSSSCSAATGCAAGPGGAATRTSAATTGEPPRLSRSGGQQSLEQPRVGALLRVPEHAEPEPRRRVLDALDPAVERVRADGQRAGVGHPLVVVAGHLAALADDAGQPGAGDRADLVPDVDTGLGAAMRLRLQVLHQRAARAGGHEL